jgi:hypothetical protein
VSIAKKIFIAVALSVSRLDLREARGDPPLSGDLFQRLTPGVFTIKLPECVI